MPSPRYIPAEPRQENPLGDLLGSFLERTNQLNVEQRESDALSKIYKEFQSDGDNLQRKIEAIQTTPGISPTTRVNTINQLLKFQEYNTELKKKAQKDSEEAAKKQAKKAALSDLERRRELEPGSLDAYEDVNLAERITRPPKEPKINQADRPIEEDQKNRIDKVQDDPHWDKATLPQKQQLLSRGGVSTSNQKPILDAIAEHQKIETEKEKVKDQAVESAYKAQEKFINETTDKYKAFETDTKPKLLQMQKLASDDELISPTANVFLEALGIPLGALEDPSSELYNKLSLDLLKGLPETYGNRILKVEVDNFLRTIPGLANSADGRRLIASNILKLGEMKEVYYDEMRKQQREYLDNNKPLPRDFQQKIFDQVRPQIDRINNDFVKLSEIKSVPKGTIPFFDPNGDVVFVPKDHAQWAQENGGRRVW